MHPRLAFLITRRKYVVERGVLLRRLGTVVHYSYLVISISISWMRSWTRVSCSTGWWCCRTCSTTRSSTSRRSSSCTRYAYSTIQYTPRHSTIQRCSSTSQSLLRLLLCFAFLSSVVQFTPRNPLRFKQKTLLPSYAAVNSLDALFDSRA